MDKKATIEPLNLIIGILMIIGGIVFLFNNPSLGALIVGIGIAIELLIKYITKILS